MGIVGAIGGALISSSSARKATNAQVAAANADREFQRETRDLIREDMQPWLQGGRSAQNALLYLAGLGPRPTFGGTPQTVESFMSGGTAPATPEGVATDGFGRTWSDEMRFNPQTNTWHAGWGNWQGQGTPGTEMFRVGDRTFTNRADADAFAAANPIGGMEYGGFTADPGYQFRFQQGVDAIDASAAARGGLDSGATREALTRFGQGIGSEEFGNVFNRIFNISNMGQNAAGMQANAQTNFAQMNSNALSNIGNAQAAGAIAQGNAWNGALNNLSSVWGAQNNGFGGFNIGRPGSLFGGNSWG